MSRRFQFSLRTMFVAVLIVAISAWGYVQQQRSARFKSFSEKAREDAEGYERGARHYAGWVANGWVRQNDGTRGYLSPKEIEEVRVWSAECHALATYCANLSTKYASAARTPWFSVEADADPPIPHAGVPRFNGD